MSHDPILGWLTKTADTIDRLIEIDRRSRVMLTFMTSHMKETTGPLGVEPLRYFQACYSEVGREFFQAAENSFVTHHALRVLFWHWMDEIERVRTSRVGQGLAARGIDWPTLDRQVVPPGQPIVPFTYESVRDGLLAGALPAAPSPDNAMMTPAECSLFARDDLIFGQLEIQSAIDWAEEVVILWDVLRATVALDHDAESSPSQTESYREAARRVAERYEAWRTAHVESTRIHTNLFRLFSAGMFGFVGDRFGAWTISPVLMQELYLEIAAGVAALRGESDRIPALPAARYWRRTPWTPSWFAPGAAGLPPFA